MNKLIPKSQKTQDNGTQIRHITVGAIIIGVALFFEKSKLRALIWHKPDLSIIISNKVMTF